MKKHVWYLIGVRHPKDITINNYVECIEFRNRFWKDFQNNTISFVPDSRYALRLKSKGIANELKKCVQKAVPNLVVEVLEIDDGWMFKL